MTLIFPGFISNLFLSLMTCIIESWSYRILVAFSSSSNLLVAFSSFSNLVTYLVLDFSSKKK